MLTATVKTGKYTEAGKYIDRILGCGVYTADAAAAFLLICKHINRCDEAVDYAENCLSNVELSHESIRSTHMHLAATLDQQQNFDEAWRHLSTAKKMIFSPDSYDPVIHKNYIDRLIATFTPATFLTLPRSNVKHGDRPIFIIGMPRSGTSLVEQILSAHPEVHGGGELMEISTIIKELPAGIDSDRYWPECIYDFTANAANRYANRYLSHLDEISATSRYVTDKMPHNFYALGLIRLLFPDARIIHCRRQALDTCLSIYFQNFQVGHEYANNLFNLGTHYHQYLRLMQHWREVLPGRMMEIDYENLVKSPESVINEILEYSNLPWHDKCLQPHTSERKVHTASFDQVRQPIHSRSVERWRAYEQYLDELKQGLERGC
jgi:hypothetical protein